MSHYTANLRDLEFNLFEFLDTKDRFGTGPFEQMDAETARGVLAEIRRLAEGPIAESFTDADRNPPVFDAANHSVTLPESFKKSVRALEEGEWYRLDLPDELGGFGAPVALRWAAYEMVLGANPAVFMYGSGPAFGATLYELGTPEQKKLAQLMVEKKWGATMVLTEPDAGSDVGAGRTKAVQQPDGSWHIHGVKRFITSAEHDLSDNIIHLVLARPEGAKAGTKGLSLFVVPKFHVDLETGALGERNGVYVTNVEKKMGLKVSTTCEVTFGDGPVPAKGWLVGDVHDGIAQMFRIIEYARMFVGTKAIATLSAGYSQALAYAKERVQGADLTATAKDAPRVTITHHPDVRRSLMLQKAYTEGMRALYLYTATFRDQVLEAEAAGTAERKEAKLADAAEGLHREHANTVPVPRLLPRPGAGGRGGRHRRQRGGEARRARQRPAAAGREGLRLGAGHPAAHPGVAADPGRFGLPAGLPDRAVHPGLQDRHPLRGHDGDPGAGLLLPQDRQGRRRRADLARLADQGDHRRRGGQRPAQGGAGAAGHGALRRAGHAHRDVRPPRIRAGGHLQPVQGR